MNIIEAAASGSIDAVRECIARGDDVNIWDQDGDERFVASWHAMMRDWGNGVPSDDASTTPSFHIKTGDDAIKAAARYGHSNIITLLVESGAKVNVEIPNRLNDTALIVAAKNGHVDAVACLLKYGAKLEHKDSTGNTALTHAIKNSGVVNINTKYTPIVKILVEYGADTHFKSNIIFGESFFGSKTFCTPLDLVCLNRNIEAAKILLVNGAELSKSHCSDIIERTAYHAKVIKVLHTAIIADMILFGRGEDLLALEEPRIVDNDYIDLFTGRIIHHLTKTTKTADIASLENYLAANQAALPYDITQQTYQAIAIYKLPDSLLKAATYMADDLTNLDQAMINRIYDNFKNKALKHGIEVDYQEIIKALDPKLLPAALIKKITDLISEAEMDFAMFEAGWRSKIEHISPVPPLMFAKDKDSYSDEEYLNWTIEQKAWDVVESSDEATCIYYHNHPDEVTRLSAYFGRILESEMPDMSWNGIYDTVDSTKYILPAKYKPFLDEGSNRVKDRNEYIKSIVDEIFEETWMKVEFNMIDQDDEVHLFGADEWWGGCVVS